MLGPEFASCWLKLGRAEEHANTFYTELKTWVDGDPYQIAFQDSPGVHYFN